MNDGTLLNRQVNPAFIQNGMATEIAFRLSSGDGGKLSVSNGDMMSAADSWHHHTSVLGRKSAGVLAVTVKECSDIALSTVCDGVGFPAHSHIDFQGLSEDDCRGKRKLLFRAAHSRGWQHQA